MLIHQVRLQTTLTSLGWSPDGTRVVVGGINGMTTRWEADTAKLLATMYVSWPDRNDVIGSRGLPSAKLVAMAHGARGIDGVTLWNPASGTVAPTVRAWVAYPALDGGVIVARNSANAAEASGCQPGDRVFVSRRRP